MGWSRLDAAVAGPAGALALLEGEARAELEGIVRMGAVRYRSEFTDSYYNKGRDEGRDEGVLLGQGKMLVDILEHRGIQLGEDDRERISACSDPAVMDLWSERAWTVRSAAELFEE